MEIEPTPIPGLVIIAPRVFAVARGFFLENFHARRYAQAGIDARFVQDNHSHSRAGVLRGLHYQRSRPQAQLVYVSSGAIFDAVVDLRRGSPTFGHWFGAELSADNKRQIYMPPGFAHGFCVTGDHADVHYKVSELYDGGDEGGIAWNDPNVAINWPLAAPIVAERDAAFRCLNDISEDQLPNVSFGGTPNP